MASDEEFVKALEKRSMSTWTPGEMNEYNRITDQTGEGEIHNRSVLKACGWIAPEDREK